MATQRKKKHVQFLFSISNRNCFKLQTSKRLSLLWLFLDIKFDVMHIDLRSEKRQIAGKKNSGKVQIHIVCAGIVWASSSSAVHEMLNFEMVPVLDDGETASG